MHFLWCTKCTGCMDVLRTFVRLQIAVYIAAFASTFLHHSWAQNAGGFMGAHNPWLGQMQAQLANMFHPGSVGLVNPPINPILGLQHHIRAPIRPDLRSNSPPLSVQSGLETVPPNPVGTNTQMHRDSEFLNGLPNSFLPNMDSTNQASQSTGTVDSPRKKTPTPDCPGGCDIHYVCYGGGCQLEGDSLCSPMCKDNHHCDHGHCIYAPCVPLCSHGKVCKNKRCVPVPCEPRCPEGQFCDAGLCKLDDSKAICDPPCPPGYRCHTSSLGRSHCDNPTTSISGTAAGLQIQHAPRRQECPGGCPTGSDCVEGVCRARSVVIDVKTPQQVKPVPASRDQPQPKTRANNAPPQGDNSCRPACASVDVCMAGECLTVSEARERQRIQREREGNRRVTVAQPAVPLENRRSATGTIVCGDIVCTVEEYCFNGACIGIHTGDVRRS